MKRIYIIPTVVVGLVSLAAPSSIAVASAAKQSSSTATANQQQRLQTIQAKGDQEISRRLASLQKLNSKIAAATKLSASDKATLTSEVTNEVSGLTALKAKLDAETTVAGARADAQSIINDYRVYALITPKIWLIKVADDQQATEARLQTLAGKLQTRLTALQAKGKNVSSLQTSLADMNTQISAASSISSSIESSVIGLQPTDYDSNHAVLSGDSAKLKTAHQNNAQAISDAKTIVAGIKGL